MARSAEGTPPWTSCFNPLARIFVAVALLLLHAIADASAAAGAIAPPTCPPAVPSNVPPTKNNGKEKKCPVPRSLSWVQDFRDFEIARLLFVHADAQPVV